MKKSRRKHANPAPSLQPFTSTKRIKDEYGFGIFYIEQPKDMNRVQAYLANPTNAALVVLARGVRKKDLALPRATKTRKIRVVRIEDLGALIKSGNHLPRFWKK